jgi:hypothetical protein
MEAFLAGLFRAPPRAVPAPRGTPLPSLPLFYGRRRRRPSSSVVCMAVRKRERQRRKKNRLLFQRSSPFPDLFTGNFLETERLQPEFLFFAEAELNIVFVLC